MECFLKILVVIDDLLPGGTESNLLNMSTGLSSDTKMTIVSLYGRGPLISSFEEAGVSVLCLELKRHRFLRAFSLLRQLALKERFDDALCARDVSRAMFPFFLSLYVPNVFMAWGNPVIHRSFPRALMERAQLRFAHGYLCSSNVIAAALRERYAIDHASVIHNCVRLEDFTMSARRSGATSEPLRIISVGNFRDEKNHLEQVKIIDALVNCGLSVELTMVGEGPNRKAIETMIDERGLDSAVTLVGRRLDVPRLLSEADLFLFTSKSEGFGVAIIEAMAAGLPCVLYDLPVLREIDPESRCLTTIPQGDVAMAVEEITALASDVERRNELGSSGRRIVEANFSPKVCASRYEQALRND